MLMDDEIIKTKLYFDTEEIDTEQLAVELSLTCV